MEKTPLVDINVEFPFAIQSVHVKRTVLRILSEEAKLFLNLCLYWLRKFSITLTKCVSEFKNYSFSHVSASAALVNRLVLPLALSFFALCIAF